MYCNALYNCTRSRTCTCTTGCHNLSLADIRGGVDFYCNVGQGWTQFPHRCTFCLSLPPQYASANSQSACFEREGLPWNAARLNFHISVESSTQGTTAGFPLKLEVLVKEERSTEFDAGTRLMQLFRLPASHLALYQLFFFILCLN